MLGFSGQLKSARGSQKENLNPDKDSDPEGDSDTSEISITSSFWTWISSHDDRIPKPIRAGAHIYIYIYMCVCVCVFCGPSACKRMHMYALCPR